MLPLLLACQPLPTTAPYEVPPGATTPLSDPDSDFGAWPDDVHTEHDPGTVTGRRVRLRQGALDTLGALVPSSYDIVDALQDLDGFGVNNAIFLRFSAPLDPSTVTAASTLLLRLPGGEALPHDVSFLDGDATLVVQPWFPLAEATHYALLVRSGVKDLDGEPVAASARVHALASGDPPTPDDAWTVPAWTAALEVSRLTPADVVAGTVWTTQSITPQDDAVVAFLRDEPVEPAIAACVPDEAMRRCDLTLTVTDVLGDDEVIGPDEPPARARRYALPAPVWLPAEGDGPWPIVLHGHGLGGDRFEARSAARQLTPLGVAVIGVDAPRHGDHPTAVSDGDLLPILEFFGIELSALSLTARRLRDHFRQSAWDRAQVARWLASGPDVDGDGVADLDRRVWLSGHSLGGVVGPQLLALSDDVGGAVLSVPGGRTTDIIRTSVTFAPLIAVMAPPGAPDGDVQRFFPLLQTAMDRGDPASWSARVAASDRDVLVTEVIGDTIIPNACTEHLARALALPHAGPVEQAVPGLSRWEDGFPVVGNEDGRTRALWQYDEVRRDGVPVDADHSGIWSADEHVAQLQRFFEGLRDDGVAVLVDPFAAP